ncbi:MAG TPA: hypothetical protein VLG38_01280 [Gammaproteobacteria bacterium]|nr:hypothetical protein [Gammaproteobacteria bacterium]
MGTIAGHIISYMGAISMVCLLVAVILLLHLIQQAFDRSGVLWGIISVIYPPGTYLYCRRNWDVLRSKFVLISGLMIAALVLWGLVKII